MTSSFHTFQPIFGGSLLSFALLLSPLCKLAFVITVFFCPFSGFAPLIISKAMRLKAVPVEITNHVFQAFAPPAAPPSSLFTSSTIPRRDSSNVSLTVLFNPFVSKTILKSPSCTKNSRGDTIRRSCSSNMDDVYRDDPSGGSSKDSGAANQGRLNKKLHCATSKSDQDSFLHSRFDFLEPMMLGIKPEFPDRPDHETVMWTTIEQKAKSLDFPMSLRMIKKKLQLEEGFTDCKELAYCPVKTAFASMVFIVVELQSHALRMRESLCEEDLEVIKMKVEKEMHSSFVWLFQQVFSRTPALMLHVMTLLANFTVYSASNNFVQPNTSLQSPVSETGIGEMRQIGSFAQAPSLYELGSVEEMNLWNSMVDEAMKMKDAVEVEVLDQETVQHFVSPVSVNLEPDLYEDYLRTDLLYQMNLHQEPDNPLLLCNYAQFLHLVVHDYDRAEECYKRAVQVLPPDSESLAQYANFLWTIRQDFWAAEERFLQALSINPENSYYASRYANFLWSTGGEETCFPLNNPHNPSV